MPFEVHCSARPLHADPLQSQEAAETYWWGRWRASWRAPAASPSCCKLGEQIMGIDKWHVHHAAWHAIERNRTEKAHITSYHGYWPKLISYPSDCRRRRVVEPRSRYVQIFSVAWWLIRLSMSTSTPDEMMGIWLRVGWKLLLFVAPTALFIFSGQCMSCIIYSYNECFYIVIHGHMWYTYTHIGDGYQPTGVYMPIVKHYKESLP